MEGTLGSAVFSLLGQLCAHRPRRHLIQQHRAAPHAHRKVRMSAACSAPPSSAGGAGPFGAASSPASLSCRLAAIERRLRARRAWRAWSSAAEHGPACSRLCAAAAAAAPAPAACRRAAAPGGQGLACESTFIPTGAGAPIPARSLATATEYSAFTDMWRLARCGGAALPLTAPNGSQAA